MRTIDAAELAHHRYDVAIVGAGIAGAMVARSLADRGRRVLLVEAGDGSVSEFGEFREYVDNFYTALAKIPNSPFPTSSNAPQPLVTDVRPIQGGAPSVVGWFVQTGPSPFESTYTRRIGGTTLHWFGSCPRMLPEDFEMRTRFGVAVDWPLSYAELVPYYAMAEREIGVSAEVSDQTYAGVYFEPGYQYPMHRIPPSHLDRWIAGGLAGMTIDGGRAVDVVSIPQARNGVANAAYDGGAGYQPIGAVGNPAVGQRCQGNSNCLPICPVQARYSARKTLARLPDHVHLLPRAVVSRLDVDPTSGRVTGLEAKVWRDRESPAHQRIRVEADIFVAAAHAIENAVLLLASAIDDRSGQLGRNLMDHPAILSWGLAPRAIGAFRGPGLTSTIPAFRSGPERAERAGFVLEIGNWGWSWPKDEPSDTVSQAVDAGNLFGAALRRRVSDVLPRQVRFDMMTEQLPSAHNRVTIDPAYRDPLGSFRPVLSYSVDAYSQAGMVRARSFARDLFRRLGIEDFTTYDPSDPGYFVARGQGYAWAGVGHLAGTHVMGKTPASSVVDHRQRAWSHDNLYIVGCGSFPTMGTSNPTLTMSALSFRTAEYIERDLGSRGART